MTSTPLRPVLAIAFVVLVAACARSPRSTLTTSPVTAPSKTVKYRGASLEVPSGWPVYDLAADPNRCARFDVHAVYLGHQGGNARCPARLIGKSEAVQVEPLDATARGHLLATGAMQQIHGQAASLEQGSDASHNLVETYPGLGLLVTASFNRDRTIASGIVQSLKVSTP